MEKRSNRITVESCSKFSFQHWIVLCCEANKLSSSGSGVPCTMSEADKYSRNGKDKFLIREKSLATKAVHNEIDVCRNRISMGRSWNGAGRGFKALPKSLVFAKCCKPTTLSIDETGEEENWTTTRSKGHSFLYHNTIEDSVEEDTRLSCIQDGVLHDANEDIDRSSCMWRFKGLECDSMSVAKGSRRSLDNSKYAVFDYIQERTFQINVA